MDYVINILKVYEREYKIIKGSKLTYHQYPYIMKTCSITKIIWKRKDGTWMYPYTIHFLKRNKIKFCGRITHFDYFVKNFDRMSKKLLS